MAVAEVVFPILLKAVESVGFSDVLIAFQVIIQLTDRRNCKRSKGSLNAAETILKRIHRSVGARTGNLLIVTGFQYEVVLVVFFHEAPALVELSVLFDGFDPIIATRFGLIGLRAQ